MIFQYTSCPVCNCSDVFIDSDGFEQCHACLHPYTYMPLPLSDFLPTSFSWSRVYD